MTSYLMSMPIMMYNLGVEMIYVLCTRLKAQQIDNEKSLKVVHDVVIALFDKKFMNEMRKKQEIAKHQAVRQLFDKLAHSSIMKLNQISMNKLFDLMMMTFKYQILRIKFPEEIYQFTLNHLNSLLEMLVKNEKENEDVIILLKENIEYFEGIYGKMSPYEYLILKQTILRFFQGKNVKVSIFMQEGIQSNEGTIQLPMTEQSPPGVKLPGSVIKYKHSGEINYEYKLNFRLASFFVENNHEERIKIKSTSLGENIYDHDRKTKLIYNSDHQINQANNREDPIQNKILGNDAKFSDLKKNTNSLEDISGSASVSYVDDIEKRTVNADYLKKEFGYLADLLNVPSKSADESETFKIDLFKFRCDNLKNGRRDDIDDEIILEVEREDNLNKFKNMFDDMNCNEGNDDGDDLLDLMDKA